MNRHFHATVGDVITPLSSAGYDRRGDHFFPLVNAREKAPTILTANRGSAALDDTSATPLSPRRFSIRFCIAPSVFQIQGSSY